MKRFQESKWYVKLWRYRHYVYIPFKFIRYRWRTSEGEFSNKDLWSILVGVAQCDMNWVYTSEEVFKGIHDD